MSSLCSSQLMPPCSPTAAIELQVPVLLPGDMAPEMQNPHLDSNFDYFSCSDKLLMGAEMQNFPWDFNFDDFFNLNHYPSSSVLWSEHNNSSTTPPEFAVNVGYHNLGKGETKHKKQSPCFSAENRVPENIRKIPTPLTENSASTCLTLPDNFFGVNTPLFGSSVSWSEYSSSTTPQAPSTLLENQIPSTFTPLTLRGPPEIVNVANPIETEHQKQRPCFWAGNSRSIPAQKRPLEYTGLLSDVIKFDSAPVTMRPVNLPEQKKKKVEVWTTNEHELFLTGLKRFGKGRWKRISEEVVRTKTPAQVSSHAQKFFLRQRQPENKRKRPSINDITTVHRVSMTSFLAGPATPVTDADVAHL